MIKNEAEQYNRLSDIYATLPRWGRNGEVNGNSNDYLHNFDNPGVDRRWVMKEIKKIVDLLKTLPDDRSIILGIADKNAADIIFMRGDVEPITNIIEICLNDLNKHINKEQLN